MEKYEISIKEFLNFVSDARSSYELVEGEIVPLCPEGYLEKRVCSRIYAILCNYFRGSDRMVYHDAYIRLLKGVDTLRRPTMFVGRSNISLGDKELVKTPELIVDIINSVDYYLLESKRVEEYKQAKILEFWIVNTVINTVDIYCLDFNTCSYSQETVVNFQDFNSKLFYNLSISLVEYLEPILF